MIYPRLLVTRGVEMWLLMIEGDPIHGYANLEDAKDAVEDMKTSTKNDLPGSNQWDIYLKEIDTTGP